MGLSRRHTTAGLVLTRLDGPWAKRILHPPLASGRLVERVVISMGGSVLAAGQADAGFIARLADALDRLSQERHLLVVVGGGKPARDAIALARRAEGTEEMLDRIGIQATRLNAQTLLAFLAARGVPCNDDVPLTTADATAWAQHHRIVVMGGTTPGHSTDYVGVELAQVCGAIRFIIATNVDGVYDKDPRIHGDAKRIDRLGYEELIKVVGGTSWTKAGAAGVVDGPATALLRASRIPTCVVDGADLDNLAMAVAGQGFDGTIVGEAA